MPWKEQLHPDVKSKDSDCKVRICNATRCLHNKNKGCMLPHITITEKGQCEQFKEGHIKDIPWRSNEGVPWRGNEK